MSDDFDIFINCIYTSLSIGIHFIGSLINKRNNGLGMLYRKVLKATRCGICRWSCWRGDSVLYNKAADDDLQSVSPVVGNNKEHKDWIDDMSYWEHCRCSLGDQWQINL